MPRLTNDPTRTAEAEAALPTEEDLAEEAASAVADLVGDLDFSAFEGLELGKVSGVVTNEDVQDAQDNPPDQEASAAETTEEAAPRRGPGRPPGSPNRNRNRAPVTVQNGPEGGGATGEAASRNGAGLDEPSHLGKLVTKDDLKEMERGLVVLVAKQIEDVLATHLAKLPKLAEAEAFVDKLIDKLGEELGKQVAEPLAKLEKRLATLEGSLKALQTAAPAKPSAPAQEAKAAAPATEKPDTPKAEAGSKFEPCVACEGTGKNSSGGPCKPCKGSGAKEKKPPKPEAEEPPIPTAYRAALLASIPVKPMPAGSFCQNVAEFLKKSKKVDLDPNAIRAFLEGAGRIKDGQTVPA